MNREEILNAIPASWDDVTLEQYNRILDVNTDVENDDDMIDKVIEIAAKILDIDISVLRGLDFPDVTNIIKKLMFIFKAPEPLKKPLEIMKDKVDFSWDNHITVTQLTADPDKIPYRLKDIVKTIVKPDVKPDDIDKMSVTDVVTLFFFATKLFKKTTRTIHISLLKQVLKETAKRIWNGIIGKKTKQK